MELRRLQPEDFDLLLSIRDGLFDNPVDPAQARAFLASPLHLMIVALVRRRAVAFASGTILLHPDKSPSLFINEVATHPDSRRHGYGRAVTRALIAEAAVEGCADAWLATERDNDAARALYRSINGAEADITLYGWGGSFQS